jgi:penicillin amidase
MRSSRCFFLLLLPFLQDLPVQAAWEVVSATNTEEVHIFRDEFGVPHVFAETLGGVSFGHGYAIATDRLAQMIGYRDGTREVLGYQGDGITSWADQFALLPSRIRHIYNAYAAGVNFRIAEVQANPSLLLPLDLVGRTPLDPWTALDSFSVFVTMADRFGGSGSQELGNLAQYNALGPVAFNSQYPINNPAAPTTIRSGTATLLPSLLKRESLPKAIPSVSIESLRKAMIRFEEQQRNVLDVFNRYRMPTSLGSFAVTVHPARAVDGKPLLLGCPQMGTPPAGQPQISCQVGLYGAGWEVAGMTFAGVPMVLIGGNRHMAWTTTSGITDNMDIFIEQLNPANTTQYWHNGTWVTAEQDLITGQWYTVHGSVFATDLAAVPPIAYTQRVTYWGSEWRYLTAFIGMADSTNLTEFRQAAYQIPGSHNFLCAGRDGHIWYIHGGMYPLRAPTVDPRLPSSGTGAQDWLGMIPPENLPQQTDPPEGFFANWNNKPVVWWNHGDRISWPYASNHVTAIQQVLDPLPLISYLHVRTVPQSIWDHGTYQQVIEPGPAPIRAENIGVAGQDGFIPQVGVRGPHFSDQDPIFYGWDFKPFYFFLSDGDQDQDGMPNEWESRYLLDPLADDAAADPDGDLFDNLTEYQNGTDPRDAASHPEPSSITHWQLY